MNLIVGASLAGAVVLAAFALLIWRLMSSASVRGVDPDWVRGFSVGAYRPMERLLSEDDVRFLRSQPGYEPRMERTLRADRRRVFRSYLRDLGRDFNRLHLALRLVALHSPHDRPDLAAVLIKQKLLFFVALAAVHVRLALYTLGLGTVDVRGLVASLETLRVEVRSLIPAPVAVSEN